MSNYTPNLGMGPAFHMTIGAGAAEVLLEVGTSQIMLLEIRPTKRRPGTKNEAPISHFLTLCKLYGRVRETSESLLPDHPLIKPLDNRLRLILRGGGLRLRGPV